MKNLHFFLCLLISYSFHLYPQPEHLLDKKKFPGKKQD